MHFHPTGEGDVYIRAEQASVVPEEAIGKKCGDENAQNYPSQRH